MTAFEYLAITVSITAAFVSVWIAVSSFFMFRKAIQEKKKQDDESPNR